MTGCSATADLQEVEKVLEETVSKKAKSGNISTYQYYPDSKFKAVHFEEIEDGTINHIRLTILVHRETKVMYLLTEKFQSGYGITMEKLVDENGQPLLYDGEL